MLAWSCVPTAPLTRWRRLATALKAAATVPYHVCPAEQAVPLAAAKLNSEDSPASMKPCCHEGWLENFPSCPCKAILTTCTLCMGLLTGGMHSSHQCVRANQDLGQYDGLPWGKFDLMLDSLPGAAFGSPATVLDPAWWGSQCWVKYRRTFSGTAVITILLLSA